MLDPLIGEFAELWRAGGLVMGPLVILTAVLWYALGWRFFVMISRDRTPLRLLIKAARDGEGYRRNRFLRPVLDCLVSGPGDAAEPRRAVLDTTLADARLTLRSGQVIVRTIVTVAPLLGLLGTVTGMIETFRSLGEMELFTQGGGVAGGIGEALLTTQMGLSVAVPGLIVGRLLDRRQRTLEGELEQIEEMVHSGRLEAA